MPDNYRVELEKTHFVQWECSKRCLYRLEHSLSENQPTFTGVELINIHENQEIL